MSRITTAALVSLTLLSVACTRLIEIGRPPDGGFVETSPNETSPGEMDLGPLSAPEAVTLLSGNTTTSRSYSPDFEVTFRGSAAIAAEVAVFTEGGTISGSWQRTQFNRPVRLSGLSLADGGSYRLRARMVDKADKTSAQTSSELFSVDEVQSPFHGVSGLPAMTGTLVDPLVFQATRDAPRSARAITFKGTVDPYTVGGWHALFIRAEDISFDNALLTVRGEHGRANTGNFCGGGAGGAGASGGGGGGTAFQEGVAGGSGTDGLSAPSAACKGGSGGIGTLATSGFNTGFLYGSGGEGGGGASGVDGAGGGGHGNPVSRDTGGDGGGGGGGLIVLETLGRMVGDALLDARGGNGGHVNLDLSPTSGTGGGGGVIYVIAAHYEANLYPNVQGGWGLGAGEPGAAHIFQRNADGSLTRRAFHQSWGDDSVASDERIGPIPTRIVAAMSAARAGELVGAVDTTGNTPVAPILARALRVSGDVRPGEASPHAIFIVAGQLTFSAGKGIDVSGSDGQNPSGLKGGAGGHGCAGGGGGAAAHGTGGDGGTDSGHGLPATGGGTTYFRGVPGAGTLALHPFKGWYAMGLGGNGGRAPDHGPSTNRPSGRIGLGGTGCGGGGAGGGAAAEGGGGGGGGGGLIVILAETISGKGYLRSRGGKGGLHTPASKGGGGGGGGVIWVAAKSYDGGLAGQVDVAPGTGGSHTPPTAGTARIFQWNADNSLSPKTFTDTW